MFQPGNTNSGKGREIQSPNSRRQFAQLSVIGMRDAAMRQLTENLQLALTYFPMNHQIKEISEPTAVEMSGAGRLPALTMDGMTMSEGRVPSVPELIELFRNRYLLHSKLFRLKKILTPVDLSENSGNALKFAHELAAHTRSVIEVCYAMDSIYEGHVPSASGVISNYTLTMRKELDLFVQETLGVVENMDEGEPGGSAPALVTEVHFGFPDKVIEEASKGADLIVMGTTGKSMLSVQLFGSVSTEVAQSAHCPVLFVPPHARFEGFRHILYAGHFESADSLRIRQAVTFAQRFDSQVHFVHVGPKSETDIMAQYKNFETDYLATQPVKPFLFTKVISDHDVAQSLLDYALGNEIDLLVFVTRHRNFWEGLTHKSVSRDALLKSRIPILIIHSDDDLA